MKVAVAGGKGGSGKTTVAVGLAVVAAESGREVRLLDCDVEGPNCHIFLDPRIDERIPVESVCPVLDPESCTMCGECGRACRFGAIAALGKTVVTFPELCHGCGACVLVCPGGALSFGSRELGVVELGRAADGFPFARGVLSVGEPRASEVTRQLRLRAEPDGRPPGDELVVLDAPPGTGCAAVAAVRDVDYVCLLAEPTPFGEWDLALGVEMTRRLGVPFGVVVNRCDIGDDRIVRLCRKEGIPVLAEFPESAAVARAYSRGEVPARVLPEVRARTEALLCALDGAL